jgi:secreted trypsin-like serine protease
MLSAAKISLFASILLAILSRCTSHDIVVDDRIMRGIQVNIKDMPYMVALFKTPYYQTIATGTIISSRWVLTAAHVFYDFLQ